jgi:DNA repair protein RecN (Recombination protein N)
MLKSLYIRNYAIIDEVNLEFDSGFNVITGETGAGKSILLGALSLILGKRADTKVLYDSESKCIVEATFMVSKSFLNSMIPSEDYDLEEQIKLRREINNSGKSRAFINDTPVNLGDLKEVVSQLVDIHNQFDTLSITTQAYQLGIIDSYADSTIQQQAYRHVFHEYVHLKKELAQLKTRQSKGQEDLEYLVFQLDELNKIKLDGINQIQIEEEYQTLSNSEEIQRVLSHLVNELTETEYSIESRLIELNRELSHISSYSKPLDDMAVRLDQTIEDLQDIQRECAKLSDQIEHDPEKVAELKEMLDHIYFLQKKHKLNDIEELIQLRDELEERTSGTMNMEELIAKKEAAVLSAKKLLWEKAEALTAKRSSCLGSFSKNIEKRLIELAIPNAQIEVRIKELADFDESGIDHVDIRFSSNKGISPQSIEGVASGGELSRLALSVKSLMAGHTNIPTMIFDEIDAGISGAVALQLSRILTDMSKIHQVICITHSPQVASADGRHFFIHKKDTAERTITHVNILSAAERIDEIAKMLSTNPPTEAALANARELLKVNH